MKWFTTVVRLVFLTVFLLLMIKGKVILWLGLFALSLIAAVFLGRVYCGYACPMNTLMIPSDWLGKKMKIQTNRIPAWLQNKPIAWIALIFSLVSMLLAKRILQINIPVLPIWLVVSVLVTLRYQPSVFHNLICPFGPLQKWFGKWALFSKKVNPDACIGCKLCEKVCPSTAIQVSKDNRKAVITSALCHQCTNCQAVCPKDAIHYQKT